MSYEPIDTFNHELVGVHGEMVVLLRRGIRMTRDQALGLAAWLVVIADPDGRRFERVLAAVRNT